MIDEQPYYCEFKPNSHNITLSSSRPIRLRVSDRWGWIMRRERLHLKQVRTDRSFPITSVLIYEVRSADRFFPGTNRTENNQRWSERKLQENRRTKEDEEVKHGLQKHMWLIMKIWMIYCCEQLTETQRCPAESPEYQRFILSDLMV